jgi:hypothetical protein
VVLTTARWQQIPSRYSKGWIQGGRGSYPSVRGTDQLKMFKHVFDSYHDDIFKTVFRLGLVLRQASKKNCFKIAKLSQIHSIFWKGSRPTENYYSLIRKPSKRQIQTCVAIKSSPAESVSKVLQKCEIHTNSLSSKRQTDQLKIIIIPFNNYPNDIPKPA